jgi:hypothetical protein
LNSIIFIKEKRCGRIKARAFSGGHPQQICIIRQMCPQCFKNLFLEASKGRLVQVYDIPGIFFIQNLKK